MQVYRLWHSHTYKSHENMFQSNEKYGSHSWQGLTVIIETVAQMELLDIKRDCKMWLFVKSLVIL